MFSFFFLALACSEPGHDETDPGAMPYCDEISQSVARDDDTGIGIPASDLLDALPFAEDLSLTWAEDVDDSLSWSFAADESTLALVESEAVYPESDGLVVDIGVVCSDYISVAGTLSLASGDGRLQEDLEVTLQLYSGGMVSEGPLAVVSKPLETTDLQGALDTVDYIDPGQYDSVSLYLSGEIYFGEELLDFVGQLQGRGESTDGDMAILESVDIATWGPGGQEE